MEERLQGLEQQLAELMQRVERLESLLVSTPPASPANEAAAASPAAPTASAAAAPDSGFGNVVALLGRSCLVFCGAFVLRALTEAGALPQGLGVAAGLFYAGAWLAAAWHTARRPGPQLGAELHGLSSLLISLPLIFEATCRFQVMQPGTAALTLAVFAAAALTLLWHRPLPLTAWALSLSTSVLALLLARFTFQIEIFSPLLVTFAVAFYWLGRRREIPGIQWFPAMSANLAVLGACFTASTPGGPHPPYQDLSPQLSMILALVLILAYLSSTTANILGRRGKLGVFELVQGGAAVAVGLGGAGRLTAAVGYGSLLVGLFAALLGLGLYALAYSFVERRHGRGPRFIYFSSLALVLVVGGGLITARPTAMTLICTALALGAAILGARFDRITLRTHAAALMVVAAAQSGLLRATMESLWYRPNEPWSELGSFGVVVLICLWAAYLLLAGAPKARENRWQARLPRFVLAGLAGLGLSGLVIRLALAIPQLASSAAALAAVRSSVLAAAVLALAALGRRESRRELRWLVYPLLLLAGSRLLLVDLRVGSGLTLFPTFAVFGLVLLLTPRLLRQRE